MTNAAFFGERALPSRKVGAAQCRQIAAALSRITSATAQRLRDRFRDAGAATLPDYELLELLFSARSRAPTPRRPPRL